MDRPAVSTLEQPTRHIEQPARTIGSGLGLKFYLTILMLGTVVILNAFIIHDFLDERKRIAKWEPGLNAADQSGQSYGYLVKRAPSALDLQFDTVHDLRRALQDSPQPDTVSFHRIFSENAEQLLASVESPISTDNIVVREREKTPDSPLNWLFVVDVLCLRRISWRRPIA